MLCNSEGACIDLGRKCAFAGSSSWTFYSRGEHTRADEQRQKHVGCESVCTRRTCYKSVRKSFLTELNIRPQFRRTNVRPCAHAESSEWLNCDSFDYIIAVWLFLGEFVWFTYHKLHREDDHGEPTTVRIAVRDKPRWFSVFFANHQPTNQQLVN